MKRYQRLTPGERYQIKALKESGLSIREIAKNLRREPSSISRELKRNKGDRAYRPMEAQAKWLSRRQNIGPKRAITGRLKRQIDSLLQIQWSPEQISARLRNQKRTVSHETIYQYVYWDQKVGGVLYLNLRRKRRWRKTHQASRNFKNVGKRVNQLWIDERPKLVEKRRRLGDYERDTMLGKKGAPILLTMVDRTSRLTKIALISGINAEQAHKATISLLKRLTVKTITNDNGPEFALHKKTAKALGAKIYFNHPYSSWQRGTNENTNGLIRQYYPKGYDFSTVTPKDIKRLEHLLNSRPRKCLDYKSPLEVHRKLSRVLR